MSPDSKRRFGLVATVVVAAALAFAGPSIIAHMSDTASADSSCGSMGTMENCAGASSAQTAHNGCAMLSGAVTSVDKGDGSVTVRLRPTTTDKAAARNALSQVRVGDNLSVAIMVGKDGKPLPAGAGSAVQAAKYACPMHREVTSDKPGKCSKCGMNLEPAAKPKR